MRHKGRYLWLQTKGALSLMAAALAGLVISVFLLCLFVYGADSFARQRREDARIKVALVLPEGQEALKSIASLAEGMDSIREFAVLKVCDYDSAMAGFEDGTYRIVTVVPEDFYEAAKHMQQAEFGVYFHPDQGYGEKKFVAILGGVEDIMLVTEDAIMALYKGMEHHTFAFSRSDIENDILDLFVREFMTRDRYFDVRFLSAYGDYDFIEYYAMSFFLVALLLLSAMLFSLYDRGRLTFERVVSSALSGRVGLYIMKVFSITVSLSVILLLSAWGADRICDIRSSLFIQMKPPGYLLLVFTGFSVSLFIHIFGMISEKVKNGRLMYFLGVLLLFLLSGGIIPRPYYPYGLGDIASCLPFASWHEMLLAAVFGGGRTAMWLQALLWDVLFIAVGIIMYLKRLNKND